MKDYFFANDADVEYAKKHYKFHVYEAVLDIL